MLTFALCNKIVNSSVKSSENDDEHAHSKSMGFTHADSLNDFNVSDVMTEPRRHHGRFLSNLRLPNVSFFIGKETN